MDTSNCKSTIGDPTGDWRAQLRADSRQRLVNKIIDKLMRHLPSYGYQELQSLAVRFEEKIYTAATSLSDYVWKISLIMMTLGTRSQNPMPDPMQSNSVINSVNLSDPGSQVMQKVNNQGQKLPISVPSNSIQPGQKMMRRFCNIGSTGMQGSSSLSSALPPDTGLQQPAIPNVAGQNLNKQNIQSIHGAQPPQSFFARMAQQLRTSNLQQPSHQLIGQIIGMKMFQKRSIAPLVQSNKMPIQQQNQQSSANLLATQVQQSQPQLQQQVMPHMQSQPGQLKQQPKVLNMLNKKLETKGSSGFLQRLAQQKLKLQIVDDQQKQLFDQQQRAMPEASSTCTVQSGNPSGGDWQEDVYQKIKAMKDLHEKLISILPQHDSLPQQPKNEQLEKLRLFKNVLERYMQFLKTPKHGILANHKDKLVTYEKQIINVINSYRQKPATPQKQSEALPPQPKQSNLCSNHSKHMVN